MSDFPSSPSSSTTSTSTSKRRSRPISQMEEDEGSISDEVGRGGGGRMMSMNEEMLLESLSSSRLSIQPSPQQRSRPSYVTESSMRSLLIDDTFNERNLRHVYDTPIADDTDIGGDDESSKASLTRSIRFGDEEEEPVRLMVPPPPSTPTKQQQSLSSSVRFAESVVDQQSSRGEGAAISSLLKSPPLVSRKSLQGALSSSPYGGISRLSASTGQINNNMGMMGAGDDATTRDWGARSLQGRELNNGMEEEEEEEDYNYHWKYGGGPSSDIGGALPDVEFGERKSSIRFADLDDKVPDDDDERSLSSGGGASLTTFDVFEDEPDIHNNNSSKVSRIATEVDDENASDIGSDDDHSESSMDEKDKEKEKEIKRTIVWGVVAAGSLAAAGWIFKKLTTQVKDTEAYDLVAEIGQETTHEVATEVATHAIDAADAAHQLSEVAAAVGQSASDASLQASMNSSMAASQSGNLGVAGVGAGGNNAGMGAAQVQVVQNMAVSAASNAANSAATLSSTMATTAASASTAATGLAAAGASASTAGAVGAAATVAAAIGLGSALVLGGQSNVDYGIAGIQNISLCHPEPVFAEGRMIMNFFADDIVDVPILEQKFAEAYNAVSLGCEEKFQRIMHNASLIDMRQNPGTAGNGGNPSTSTLWSCFVSCWPACPPEDPMFGTELDERRFLELMDLTEGTILITDVAPEVPHQHERDLQGGKAIDRTDFLVTMDAVAKSLNMRGVISAGAVSVTASTQAGANGDGQGGGSVGNGQGGGSVGNGQGGGGNGNGNGQGGGGSSNGNGQGGGGNSNGNGQGGGGNSNGNGQGGGGNSNGNGQGGSNGSGQVGGGSSNGEGGEGNGGGAGFESVWETVWLEVLGTETPSMTPSAEPSTSPPTDSPSSSPTDLPTTGPSIDPTAMPSLTPTTPGPTFFPSLSPSNVPSSAPTPECPRDCASGRDLFCNPTTGAVVCTYGQLEGFECGCCAGFTFNEDCTSLIAGGADFQDCCIANGASPN